MSVLRRPQLKKVIFQNVCMSIVSKPLNLFGQIQILYMLGPAYGREKLLWDDFKHQSRLW